MNSTGGSQFIQANGVARRVLIGYFSLLLLIAIWLVHGLDRATPPEEASPQEVRQSIEALGQLIDIFLLITLFHAVGFCWYFARLANNTVKSGQFPPPGTWVILKTRIRTGRRALISAYASYFLAVFIWLPVAVPLYLKWVLEKFT